jgi:hypothetical protein
MLDPTNNEQDTKGSYETFDSDQVSSSGGKGMRPIPNDAMINFLRWLGRQHPEISSLRDLSDHQLFHLVSEFEGGRIAWDEWSAGFNLLQNGHSNKAGYEAARKELKQSGL